MSEPILSFLYNVETTATDTAYGGTGEADGTWQVMTTITGGGNPDTLVFTGNGINAALSTPTATYGSREATLRPVAGSLIIPQTYVESYNDTIMYNVAHAGQTTYKYVFCAYIGGTIVSDLYLEAWDDNSFSTTNSSTLAGTASAPYSMINAVRYNPNSPVSDTTPSAGWDGTTYSGTGRSANLKGYTNRVKLIGVDGATNYDTYFNMYVSLPYDAPLFHGTPVISFRYLYT